MPAPVTSDAFLKARADSLRAVLNHAHALRLFANPVAVAPNTPRGQFVESAFPGYVPYDPSMKWGPLFRSEIGAYSFDLPPVVWTPTGVSGEKCYGWFITFGTRWTFAQRFAVPIDCDLLKPIPVQIRISDKSLSLCG